MRSRLVFILVIMCTLCACSTPNEDGMVFSKSEKLVAEKILINEVFSPDFITKSGNHLIISSSTSDETLFLYEIPSLTFKKATGRKGKGPDEIETFPMFCHTLNDEYLYIKGYTPSSIRKISINPDGDFSFIDEYQLDGYEEYNYMNIINDSLFVYYDVNHLAINKYNLRSQEKLDEIRFEKEDHKESYFYSNRGTISANDSFVVFSYIYKKQIEFYHVNDFKLKKRIKDGKKHPKIDIYDRENITYHYFYTYAGEKYFYAMHVGHKENDNFLDRTLEVYDYEGNPIIKYTFDIIPHNFVVDEENKYIYAVNSEYEDYLLRYQL